METSHSIIIGDSRKSLSKLPDKSVQLVFTSPPYWNIKDYENPNQIGLGQSYNDYIEDLANIWRESLRVLSPGCKLVVNVGDQFIRASENNGVYEILPIHSDITRTCQEMGFTFLGNIIWRKITTTKTTGGGAWMGSIYFPRDGYITYEHEYILIFKKKGKSPKVTPEQKLESKLPKEFRSKWFRGIWDDIQGERQAEHKAMFPLELPERIIRMFTYAGETVLDPFMGSGTTAQAAFLHNRNSIGIELNERYAKLGQKRVENMKIVRHTDKPYVEKSA
ncbi:site-specific DNA-methyltransferase [Leptospira wolffii]|uniref:DNA-methyltransferase n=1 Tax=Leptospira wolffii TaxID=409998 RepID=UPI0010827CD5|nr:site-specific DNA-methyltransferase [Leptospira wolffii]TGL53181.1 site-specific DNA-methyltransferase [Leptospira wolffii]